MDALKTVQSKHGDKEGCEATSQQLERLCNKYGIDPTDDMLTGEGSQDLDNDDDDSSNCVDFDIDDISDGSGEASFIFKAEC